MRGEADLEPMELARRRLASGELSKEQFEELKEVLLP